ncbi:MAG: ribosome silencing factor [Flavobacteriaceae bacterium]|nr:ribosome silencing factor [Flavobacteriaceae bacterium]|tara:strand:- start:330 stop:701 length:372 start_codon:yes stop_codon:yes gene_type:complete
MVKDIHDSKILLNNIINSIQEVKGDEVCTIDLRNVENNFCSYFVICNGTSNTHVNSIVGSIQKKISKELKEKPYNTEGEENAEWVLIDYVDIVVHVFQKNVRSYYKLEELWGDALINKISSKN